MRNFLTANINRAIAETKNELQGVSLGWGIRDNKQTPENLYLTTTNLVDLAAGLLETELAAPTDEKYVEVFTSKYEEYLAMCKRLYDDCDTAQREAVATIVHEILRQSKEMKVEVAAGQRQPSNSLRPLDKSNAWGRAVLALAEAFDIKLE